MLAQIQVDTGLSYSAIPHFHNGTSSWGANVQDKAVMIAREFILFYDEVITGIELLETDYATL